jgi:hypothetical protein
MLLFVPFLFLRRVGLLPKGRVKHPLLWGAGVLGAPLLLINMGLIALVWNRLGLHRRLYAPRLGLRGCVAWGVLLIVLEATIASI